ncbi:MAG: DUF4272 domain-containing protein [Burkholderiaceae bacterium]|nr:DUF4272 domain-containing protein [Burkholderiaceae bacterium]
MTPELRKEASELQLHKRGIRINVQLHVIESEQEVTLRTTDELINRMMALWLVTSAAQTGQLAPYRGLVEMHHLQPILSASETAFLFASANEESAFHQFQSCAEALYFLAWFAGLVDELQVSAKPSNLKKIAQYFPAAFTDGTALRAALQLRSKSKVLDWCDLLYRMHWAVRHAQLTQKLSPPNLNANQVREWHRAVNWICRYEEVDDWDQVSIET